MGLTTKADHRIRVCHIITKMVYGGASLYTLQLAKSLDPKRFESTIIHGSQSSNEGNLLKGITGEEVHTILIPEMVRSINLVKDTVTFIKLVITLKKNKYHIIHTHGSKAGIIGRTAAALCRAPVIIYTVHGWGLKAGGSFFCAIYRLMERIVASFTTRILFLTESDMREACAYRIGVPHQYALIRTGINLEPFYEYDKKSAKRIKSELGLGSSKIIGGVGRVSFQKNPVEFIRIAAEVRKKRDDVRFIYVGGGELLNQMQELVKEMGAGDYIMFTGVRNDIPEILANFDIFILPSLWEGMPLAAIEAMAAGKPIIAYNVSGLEELVHNGGNGYVVPPNHTSEFAGYIEFLLNNPSVYDRMRKNVRITAAEYDLRKMVLRMESLYEELARASL